MTQAEIRGLSFNALTDAWSPLVQADGTTLWASPVEVLTGEKDGVDLDYPRDDFRVYARLLLSALVQALFPAKTKAELIKRLDQPLPRRDVDARIGPVLEDFDLFGSTPFLQINPRWEMAKAKGAAPFVFPKEDLFRAGVRVDAICMPIALIVLFSEQTYAGAGGSGHGTGPGGQPGVFTLIDPGTVREAAWANTLTLESVAIVGYASDRERAWSNEKQPAKPRASIGLIGGLFFQPRGIWLIPSTEGACSFSGRRMARVTLSPYLKKSELTPKTSGAEDLWQHPCAPLVINSNGIGAVRLTSRRPAWTELAQLLSPLTHDRRGIKHPREGPAPVLRQWKALPSKTKCPRLIVLDFARHHAQIDHRFFEAFPLTDQLLGNTTVIEKLRELVDDAQDVRHSLIKALVKAHDDHKQGGLALGDAEAAFWTASEEPFFDWLAAVTTVDTWNDAADAHAEGARKKMEAALRRTALSLFNAHVGLSEFDTRKQERIAKARRALVNALYPKPDKAATFDIAIPSR